MNNTFFNTVQITNFKSLKDVTLSDCKRINLLIGKPNVGKSNIIEAIGLLGLGYSRFNKNKKLSQFIRFDNTPELFFDGNTNDVIRVAINGGNYNCIIQYLNSSHLNSNDAPELFDKQLRIQIFNTNPKNALLVDNKLDIVETPHFESFIIIKPYKFTSNIILEKQNIPYLVPPFGVNLFDVIQGQKELKTALLDIFSEYGLKLVFDNASHTLKIMKPMNKEDEEVFLLPYNSIADTLQRIIFFKTAIASNKNSILLFEEPEAHCFPPYIAHFTQDVINSSSNQFFIATHSPYVLNDFLEYERNDVAIFMADYKDGQTVINRLSDGEVNEVYDYGIDVFFNYERFTKHG